MLPIITAIFFFTFQCTSEWVSYDLLCLIDCWSECRGYLGLRFDGVQPENKRCSRRRISKDRRDGSIMGGSWGLSYPTERNRGLHYRPPFSILGSNQFVCSSTRLPRHEVHPEATPKPVVLWDHRRPESVVHRPSKPGLYRVSSITAGFWVQAAQSPSLVRKAVVVTGPARPFQSRGRCKAVDAARAWTRPPSDRRLYGLLVQSTSK